MPGEVDGKMRIGKAELSEFFTDPLRQRCGGRAAGFGKPFGLREHGLLGGGDALIVFFSDPGEILIDFQLLFRFAPAL